MNKKRLSEIKTAYQYQSNSKETYPDELITEIKRSWAINEIAVKALEHIFEVETDSYEMDKELMFNIARDALLEIRRTP